MSNGILRVSASQVSTASSCLRHWWFQKVAKCPTPQDLKRLLGEVGHEVNERFLLEEEMYPKGWESPTSRFTGEKSPHKIGVAEQVLIKTLVKKAIDDGVLLRQPDQVIEREIGPSLGKIDSVDNTDIHFIGYIDHWYGNHIDDHKFIGPRSGRYYNAAKLKKAIAMNWYAWAGYKEGFITDPTTWLRFNLFVKDPVKPVVKHVHVERTREQIEEYYNQYIQPVFSPMVYAKKRCSTWDKVSSAMDAGCSDTICKQYGGCDFLDICLGKISVDQYKERFKAKGTRDFDKVLKTLSVNNSKQEGGKMSEGFLQGLKKAEGGEKKEVENKEVENKEVENKEVVKEEPKVDKQEPQAKAPWAHDNCPMCASKPENTWGILNGEPCQVCVVLSKADKDQGKEVEMPEDYDLNVGDDGSVSWSKKGEEPVVTEEVVKEVEVKEVVQPKEPEPKPEEVKEEAKEPEPKSPLEKAVEFDKNEFNSEQTGSKGFVLSYVPVRSRMRKSKKLGDQNCVIHISELAEMVKAKILEEANARGAAAKEFENLDAFGRADMIAMNAHEIAEVINNSILDASCMISASTEHRIVCAIERYASVVYGSFR